MKIKIGGVKEQPKEKDPTEAFQETLFLTAVSRNGELVPALSFAFLTGQGTSSEVVPIDELSKYVEVLKDARENGVPTREETTDANYVPTYETLRRELYQGSHTTTSKDVTGKKGVVTNHGRRIFFRSQTAQGRRYQRVRPEQLDDVITCLEGALELSDTFVDKHWTAIKRAALIKAREEAAKAKASATLRMKTSKASDDSDSGEDDTGFDPASDSGETE